MPISLRSMLFFLLIGLLATVGRAQESLLITEFMAENDQTLRDDDGDSSDWVEIFNPGSNAVSLEGWFLSDETNNLTKWRFPNVTLLENSYLVVFASNKDKTNPAVRLHTNFRLSAGGEYLALVRPDGTSVASEFAPQFPEQQKDVSYGRDRISPEFKGYFPTPTPGGPNATSGAGFAPEIRFSHPSGTFPSNAPFQLTLSTPSPDAVIHYTLGTNAPGTNTLRYTNAISVTNSLIVRARAFAPGLLPGPISTRTYLGLSPASASFAYVSNVVNFTSDLPIMILHNFGQGTVLVDKTEQHVVVQTFEPKAGRSSLTNPPDHALRGIFHIRGSSTAESSASKASFFLEVRDEFGGDKQEDLLGLPEDSDWVLYAPNRFEPALFHNPLAMDLARQTGEYASRTRFVEVFLKDNAGTPGAIVPGDYHGIYVLMEKIKIDKNRVAIDFPEPEHRDPPEVTGGYIFSIDRGAPGEQQVNAGGASMNWVDPKYHEMTNAVRAPQVAYVKQYFNDFAAALNGPNWTNPVTGYAAYIDVDSWINRHIHEVVTFNVDSLRLSGYFHKPRNKKIHYGPAWDYDRTQGSTDGRDSNPRVWQSQSGDLGTDFFNPQNNGVPWWGRLFTSPDFWQAWIDRYQELRRDVLSNLNVFNTVDKYAGQLLAAQPREQARWNIRPRRATGTGIGTYATEVEWKKNWYSNRLDFIDGNFLAPPRLSQNGGLIAPGFALGIAGLFNSVYYTLDGSDPRLPGGGLSPVARRYEGPINLTNNVRIVARVRDLNHMNLTGPHNPPISSPWSGPVAATFVVAPLPLVITEIMYHPRSAPPGMASDGDDFEYVELKNIGVSSLDLAGVRFTNGIEFSFAGSGVTNLAPGARVLVVRNSTAFLSRYPGASNIAGEYAGSLDNSGERLYLEGPLKEPILDFAYQDSWYPTTDGLGFSLVIVNENAPLEAWGSKTNWRPSGTLDGSPGQDDPPPPNVPAVLINEALTHSLLPFLDTIELHNPAGSPANIGGWFLTDDLDQPKKLRITNGTTIEAGGFLLFDENSFNPAGGSGVPFSLSSGGEQVYLLAGDASTNLTGYGHGFSFGAASVGVTLGRYVTSIGEEHFVAQIAGTLGTTNAGPKVGPVVLNEIMYHPLELSGQEDNVNEEFVELYNLADSPVPLFDAVFPTNTWRLRNAVDFVFPTNLTLAAHGYLLVVSFDPANAGLLANFRTRYGLPNEVTVLGPYQGKLDNSTDRLELCRPEMADGGDTPFILVDEVRYQDGSPWPKVADGAGLTLQRIVPGAYGNDPVNWRAASPTAARAFGGGTPPSITTQPTNQTVVAYQGTTFHVGAGDPGQVRYQWRFNGTSLIGETNSILNLPAVLPTQDGDYSAVVFNETGAMESVPARLTVLIPATIATQPKSQNVRPGTNVTFTVTATSSSSEIRYQWRLNGTNIAGATNNTLLLTNVQPYHNGKYTVVISDAIGAVVSAAATLTVLANPVIVEQPQSQTAVAGDDVTFRVRVVGTSPFGYRWRRGNVTLVPFGQGQATLILTNVQLVHSNVYDVVITNMANLSPGVLSTPAILNVLADSNGDHVPDVWEIANGFTTNSPGEAGLDPDGDTMTNLEEYRAGTDPHDAASHLRLGLLRVDGNDVRIQFHGVTGKKYRLERMDDLTMGAWARVVEFKVGAVLDLELIDPGVASRPNRIYRITVLP